MQEIPVATKADGLDDRLTLVLISEGRAALLHRAVQYYRQFSSTLLVVDSSDVGAPGLAGVGGLVRYYHVPQLAGKPLQTLLGHAVGLVATPYMLIVREEDFVLPTATAACVAFLEAHADYGLCHGYSLEYETHADRVDYWRCSARVPQSPDTHSGAGRLIDYLGQYIPSFDAVTRTALVAQWVKSVPAGVGEDWLRISHLYFMLAHARAQVLHIPYAVRARDDFDSEPQGRLLRWLTRQDRAGIAAREQFAEHFAPLIAGPAQDAGQAAAGLLESFDITADALRDRRAVEVALLFSSRWSDALTPPQRRFEPVQYLEMPFYTEQLFAQLCEIEFVLHALPAAPAQFDQLAGPWTQQHMLLDTYPNDTPETITNRLWDALDINVFNLSVVQRLAQYLVILGDSDTAGRMGDWAARLLAVGADAGGALMHTPSGQLIEWLNARAPGPTQVQAIRERLTAEAGGPQFGILLLDLDNHLGRLQITLDSLLASSYKNIKIIVFTTGALAAATSEQDTLHFVSVKASTYVQKINQVVQQATWDWLILASVGDQFTAGGLARAGLELLQAPECRAVCADEVHRQTDGKLTPVFRPGFNLDLLQSAPGLMARHWLMRRDVVVEAGGYSTGYSDALEFELLLRIIEKGGMGWLAHLDEPLLICDAAIAQENAHERQALIRHLANRGYQALVTHEGAGTYRVEYRHKARPLVTVVLPCQDNLEQLQASLENIRLRTRYTQYEVLVVDNASQDPQMLAWLDQLRAPAGRVRVACSEQPVSMPMLYNAACRQANGEFLVLLDSAADIVNPNWLESLLNHAQRPEVGVVGAKLINDQGYVAQAGLLLGFDAGVGAAFAGAAKDAVGYMHRLVVDQNYSAVSATCLMIGKAVFNAVGGLDEDQFSTALSDVDLCLKVGQAGYLVVWTPYVQVTHPGTVVQPSATLAALREKWPGNFSHDLAYNQNLTQSGTSFTLGAGTAFNWAPLLG